MNRVLTKHIAMRTTITAVLAGLLTTIAAAQNAVTVWSTIAAQTAVRGKSTAGMTGIFLAYSDLAAFDALNAIQIPALWRN